MQNKIEIFRQRAQQIEAETNFYAFWKSLEPRLQRAPPPAEDRENLGQYEAFDNLNAYKETFIETKCANAKIHNYDEMRCLLKSLEKAHPSAKLVPIGCSAGYADPGNSLEILTLNILATKQPVGTLYFVAGHHVKEWAGSEAVYEIAKRLIEASGQENSKVQKLRERHHMVFIPQVEPDIYGNLKNAIELSREDFYLQGYSYLIDSDDKWLHRMLQNYDSNFYCTEEEFQMLHGFCSFGSAKYIKRSVKKSRQCWGVDPVLTFDYHEDPRINEFDIIPFHSPLRPLYAFAEVAKSYPVIPESEGLQPIDPDLMGGLDFSDYMAAFGQSYCFETPSDEGKFTLNKRVEMNLIATDRILARYFLGI